MSQDHTRKHFFAKLLGLIAAAGVAPKLFAKSATGVATQAQSSVGAVKIHAEARAVARSADSL